MTCQVKQKTRSTDYGIRGGLYLHRFWQPVFELEWKRNREHFLC